MKYEDGLKLENQLCFSIYATSRAITKIYRPFLEKLGITYPQYLVMLVLWEKENITLKALSNRLYLDSGTLTPLLKRLEGMELLKRQRSSEDERILCVNITEKGKELKKEALTIPECILKSINMDIEQLIKFKKDTDELLESIKNLEQ
ncbi:MarR family winged helix-turn-helix transcriptional regulator [Clostridium sp. 'White wine YQ']|uniref:MarR family winged helix-turn-helix transcriptional regulator n=1 Tax=Clostridium sp. 'White wine YQ' TaxID=3027474 RepID=UPI0023667AE1|nr:MarR family transcriptional regulator [Clostridium sp. 'White wine YQ']MDD7796195.1 MarR family transcriptional regulator [Clostridium sp. 'White wine YQ']